MRGCTFSPIVVRKSDGMAFNYESAFFNMDKSAEDAGAVLDDGPL